VNSEHIETVALKQYLLGTLRDEDAGAIEDRYFTDSLFFKRIRETEIKLICDYLDGLLNEGEQRQFEGHYLQVPLLKKLVDDVRQRRGALPRAGRLRARPLVLAGAAGLAVVLCFAVLFNRGGTLPEVPTKPQVTTAIAGISLTLAPGITKGTGLKNAELILPESPQPISLIAELPGQTASANYTAKVLNVDNEQKSVWSASGIRSTPKSGGQQATVVFSSSVLVPGDYILELAMEGGPVRATYLFRVNAALNKTTSPQGAGKN